MAQKQQDEYVQLDPNTSPEAEAEEFATPDERKEARAHNHELKKLDIEFKTLRAKQGWIGKVTGSANPNLNIAFVIIVVLCFAYIATYLPDKLDDSVKELRRYIIGGILTVAGFVFGVKSSD